MSPAKKQQSKKSKASTKSTETNKASASEQKPQPPKDAFSISALADKFDIPDRGTVRKRLKGVEPCWVAPRLKLYRLTDHNKDGQTVANLLADFADAKLEEAKTRKMMADAARSEHKLELEQGNYVSVAEVKQHAFAFVAAMHKRLAKLYSRQAAPRLFKARTVNELQRMMDTDISLIFDELKRDYPNIF